MHSPGRDHRDGDPVFPLLLGVGGGGLGAIVEERAMQPGESGIPWKYLIDGSTDTAALTAKTPTITTPSGNVMLLDGGDAVEFRCGGTDAALEAFTFRVWRWYRSQGVSAAADLYLPELAFDGLVTLGSAVYTTDVLGAAANYWASSIAPLGGRGSRAVSPGLCPPVLIVDTLGATYLQVEIDLTTAASADVFARELPRGALATWPGLASVAAGYSRVKIEQAAAGRTTLQALTAGMVPYLHELIVTSSVAGTFYIAYDNDGAGTSEVAVSGLYDIPVNGPEGYSLRWPLDGCLAGAAGKQLTIVSAGAILGGHAVVSKAWA